MAACSNDTDDSVILNERIEPIKDKTPDLNELHTDGAYGSEDNDKKMEQLEITHVQTAVRGRKAEVPMQIEQRPDGKFYVRCPGQCVSSQETRKRYKACFDVEICQQCSLSQGCPAKEQGKQRVYYFDRSDYLGSKRNRNIESLPPERRNLRPNVEATVKEFTKPFNHKGKLKVRGLFKTMLYAYSMAVSINFGRVWRYLAENPDLFGSSRSIWVFLIRLLGQHSRNEPGQVIIPGRTCCWSEPGQYFGQAA